MSFAGDEPSTQRGSLLAAKGPDCLEMMPSLPEPPPHPGHPAPGRALPPPSPSSFVSTGISPSALKSAAADFSLPLPCTSQRHDLFEGHLPSGVPLAIARLRGGGRPISAHEEVRAVLAPLLPLRHPRLARLLHTCEEPRHSAYPLALVYEALEGGRLSEYLRAPPGAAGAPLRGALTPLQRMDAALGVAQGLQYLHSQAVLHEDVRAATVGLALHHGPRSAVAVLDRSGSSYHRGGSGSGGSSSSSGGFGCGSSSGGGGGGAAAGDEQHDAALYAKLADLGLAKLGDAFASERTLGSLGYQAPELLLPSPPPATLTTATEVYAFGCLLLELLTGAALGPATASAARAAAEAAGGSAAPIVALGRQLV